MPIARHEMNLRTDLRDLAKASTLRVALADKALELELEVVEEGEAETSEIFASGPRDVVLDLVRWANANGIYPSEVLVDCDDDHAFFGEELAGVPVEIVYG